MKRYSLRERFLTAVALSLSIVCAGTSCTVSPNAEGARRLYPAVVKIEAGNRIGSGVIIHGSGLVLTSWHVVEDEKIAYVISSNGVTHEGNVLAVNRDRDLALIAITGSSGGFTCANLGSSMESDGLQVGDAIAIAGYPAYSDSVSPVLSEGIICAFPTIQSVDFIQASAQVYPGSSGGPMINKFGEVIGIVNGRYTNISAGCATFATAADEAAELMNTVSDYGASVTKKAVAERANSPRICASVGCKAPGFILTALDGQQVSLEACKGRKVLLVFAGSACPGCSQLVQCVSKIYDAWPREQLEVLVIASGESEVAVRDWVAANSVKGRVLLDKEGEAVDLYSPTALPALYFIDTYGRIKIKRTDMSGSCEAEIDTLLRLY